MLERVRSFALSSDDRLRDTLKVALANGGTLTFVHLLDVKIMAELGLITLTAAYTIWKWRREAKGDDK